MDRLGQWKIALKLSECFKKECAFLYNLIDMVKVIEKKLTITVHIQLYCTSSSIWKLVF